MDTTQQRTFFITDVNTEIQITNDLAFPPTFQYMPTMKLMRYMILKAAFAEKGEDGNYGFIF